MIVGFQGESGAFSEEAAIALLGDIPTCGYLTFDALIEAVDAREVDMGLLPCENSIHGAVARAYDVLYVHPDVAIVDETVHRIVQTLVGAPGAALPNLARIESHPVAIEQCRRFLNGLAEVEVVAVADTAGAVRSVVASGDPSRAAIGPEAAARRYGGIVLADAIQDEPENYTRFFLIQRGGQPRRQLGRAVVAFALPHEPGSLHHALGLFAGRGLNLRSLLARPQPKRPFEYVFYAEFDCPGRPEAEHIAGALSSSARLLGWY
jgi:prephenate dehydratase